jgi:hypothetical protein
MNALKMATTTAVLAAFAMAAPAMAGKLSPKERARLENQMQVNESINRDLAGAARDTDRAYRAAKGIDTVIKHTVRNVPGGGVVYSGSKAATEAAIRANEKRKRK